MLRNRMLQWKRLGHYLHKTKLHSDISNRVLNLEAVRNSMLSIQCRMFI